MTTPFERLSTQQRVLVNDLIINGFRDDPAQLERYSRAMRAERGVEAASDRFQSMLDQQRNEIAGDILQGRMRLPSFRDTPFSSNGVPDEQDLNRGRGVLRQLRDRLAGNSQGNRFDFSTEQLSGLLSAMKNGHNYEPEGISPLQLRGDLAPQPPAGRLSAETLAYCRGLGRQANEALRHGDREGANALAMEASRANCPDPSGRGR